MLRMLSCIFFFLALHLTTPPCSSLQNRYSRCLFRMWSTCPPQNVYYSGQRQSWTLLSVHLLVQICRLFRLIISLDIMLNLTPSQITVAESFIPPYSSPSLLPPPSSLPPLPPFPSLPPSPSLPHSYPPTPSTLPPPSPPPPRRYPHIRKPLVSVLADYTQRT